MKKETLGLSSTSGLMSWQMNVPEDNLENAESISSLVLGVLFLTQLLKIIDIPHVLLSTAGVHIGRKEESSFHFVFHIIQGT